jgi:hypothetical protein
MASIILIMLAYSFFNKFELSIFAAKRFNLFEVSIVVLCLLKIGFSANKILQYEWAGRPSIISNFSGYWREFKYVFHDHSLYTFLPQSSRQKIDTAEVWVSSSPVVSGYMAMLNPVIPYLDLYHLPMRGEGGAQKFQSTINQLGMKKYMSLINVGTLGLSLEWSLGELMKQGLVPLQVQDLGVPYFSHSPEYLYNFKLVELAPKQLVSMLSDRYSAEEQDKMNASLVLGEWAAGCSPIERAGSESWRWCGKSSLLRFKNFSNKDMEVSLRFNVQIVHQPGAKIVIQGKRFTDIVRPSKNDVSIDKTFKILAQEEYLIRIETNTGRYKAPGDPRELYVRLNGFDYKVTNEN